MSKGIRLALLASLALWVAAAARAADPLAPSIAPEERHARMAKGDAPLVVDVRTPEEFRAGHVPGAINVPYDQVAARAAELVGEHGVAMYCMKGPRARLGEQALLQAGGAAVLHLEGGLSAWQAGGLPVEK
jgi:rhodanese-related sulfurtransferase